MEFFVNSFSFQNFKDILVFWLSLFLMRNPQIFQFFIPIGNMSVFLWKRKWQPTPVFLPGESRREEPGGLQRVKT